MTKAELTHWFDDSAGLLTADSRSERRLADLRGVFHDTAAFDRALARDNALVYSVASVTPANGPGDLHYGLGILQPGRIGEEYFLTLGHYHTWREAAEIYIGLTGSGRILLQDEATGESRLEPLEKGAVVYVPGHTAHRTMNTGAEPLIYLGIYPAAAGHDYQPILAANFRMAVVEHDGKPVMRERTPAL